MQQYSKPHEARFVEAQARSRANTVKLHVKEPQRYYQSRSVSRPGLVHHVTRTPRGWACTCEGWTHHAMCQHVAGLSRRAIREGWAQRFTIAPRELTPHEAPGRSTP